MTDRLLRLVVGEHIECYVSPAGNEIGRLYRYYGDYYASCAGWEVRSPSYHKARAALATELRRRRWTLPQ